MANSYAAQMHQLDDLIGQLKEVEVRITELKAKMANRQLRFSGEVYIRQCGGEIL
jgi:hypothetical protein